MGTGSLYPQHMYVGYVAKDATGKPHKTRGYILNVADYKSSDPIRCRGSVVRKKVTLGAGQLPAHQRRGGRCRAAAPITPPPPKKSEILKTQTL